MGGTERRETRRQLAAEHLEGVYGGTHGITRTIESEDGECPAI